MIQHSDLTSIDLRDCEAVTDKGLALLAESCPELHPDKLLSCAKGDLYCQALSKRRTGLTTINLENCKEVTNDSLLAFMTHCPGLIHINLAGCDKVCALVGLRPRIAHTHTHTTPPPRHIFVTGNGRYPGEADD